MVFLLFDVGPKDNSVFSIFRKFEVIEPQLSVLARLCVYCIISSLEIKSTNKKRTLSLSDQHDREARLAKVRKIEDSPHESVIPSSQDTTNVSNGNNAATTPSHVKIREPLKVCLQDLFQTLYQLTFSNEMTPKILFVQQFLTFFHRCGGTRITPVLSLIPSGLMKNLLKIISSNEYTYDFILK